MAAKVFCTALMALLLIMTSDGRVRAEVDSSEIGESAAESGSGSSGSAPLPEMSGVTGEQSPDAAQERRGTLLWDKVLSVVGLYEERPFVPDKVGGAPPSPGEDYIIGPSDQIGISVWRDDTLTKVVMVLPDGKIQFPLVGEMVAAGKTVAQLKKELNEKLAGYLVDSDLSVEVRQSNSMFVYLIGKVNAPGKQMLMTNTNVLQALASAGGLNPFAEQDKIRIIRQEGSRTLIYPFRYSLVAEGNNLEENIWLKRGDIIIVP